MQRRVPKTEIAVSHFPRCVPLPTYGTRLFMIAILMLQPPPNLNALDQLLPSLDGKSLLLCQCAFFCCRGRLPVGLSSKRFRRVLSDVKYLAYLHQSLFLALRNHNAGDHRDSPLLLEFKASLNRHISHSSIHHLSGTYAGFGIWDTQLFSDLRNALVCLSDKQSPGHHIRTLTRQMNGPFWQHRFDIQVDVPKSVGGNDILRCCSASASEHGNHLRL